MKGFLSILFFLFFINATKAQQWEWAKEHGSGIGRVLKMDPFGNIFTCSTHSLFKSDTAGNLIWAKGLPFYISGLSLDKVGNVFVSGYFTNSITIPGGINPNAIVTPADVYDAILCKFDNNGNLKWVFTWDNNKSDQDFVDCSQTDANGNTYLFGHSFYFPHSHADPDIDNFVLKVDSSGTLVWNKTNNWLNDVAYRSVDVDNSGVYFTGEIRYTGNVLGQQLTSNFFSTIFLGKMTEAGNLIWLKTDGSANDLSFSILSDKKGAIYFTGKAGFQSNFSGNILTYGMVLAKYDTSGNSLWVRTANMNNAYQCALDQEGSVFVTGQMAGNPTPNSPAVTTFSSPGNSISLSTNKQCEIFVVKYDQNGNVKWGIAPTGPYWSGNSSYSIVHDQNKSCYITGAITGQQTYFGSTMLSNTMSSNIFMARLRDTIASVITNISKNEKVIEMKLIPNPGTDNSILSIGSSDQIKSYKVEILSTDGKKLYQRDKITEQSHALDLTTFTRGLYFVRVEAISPDKENFCNTIKLIIN